jgi:hypothetical protein
MKRLIMGIVLGALALGACNRSNEYKKDQEFYAEGKAQGYYDGKGGARPAEKFESMGQPKKRLVVFDLWNDTPVKEGDFGRFAGDELRRLLYSSRRVLIPEDLQVRMTTEDFIHGDQVKVAQLIREGRKLGVAVLVIGRISKVTFRTRGDEVGILRQKQSLSGVEVELKVFDVATGREILAVSKPGEATANALVTTSPTDVEAKRQRAELTQLALRRAMSLATPEILRGVEKLGWQGHVAKVMGNKLYINAGRQSGLVGGDILKVTSPGDDVYDPITGAYLGRSVGQLKGTLEVVDFIGPDAAVTEVHTGGNFQEGDLVKLY